MQTWTRTPKFVLLALVIACAIGPSETDASLSSTHDLLNTMAHAFNDIARKAGPAVVSISTVKSVGEHEAENLLGEIPGLDLDGQKEMIGIGSGVIVRPDGTILTNNHVVENAEKITVYFDERHKTPAHVIGTDPKTDLAVIQVDDPVKNLTTLPFGNSDKLKVGDWAIAIGSPFGLTQSMSFGIISAKGRARMGILDTEDFIQTDAAINPGSSGGPLLNESGEVIGINTAIYSQGGGFMGIGFAIPSRIAREISDQIIAHGHVMRGWLGLMAQDMDEDLANHFKAPSQKGALISDIADSGPASHADLRPGDVVVSYDNRAVDSASDFKAFVGKTPAGSQVPMKVMRAGAPIELAVAVEEQPALKTPLARAREMAGTAAKNQKPSMGLATEDLPPELSRFLKLPPRSGVLVVRVTPGGEAFDAGLAAGDVILKMNEGPLKGSKDFRARTRRLKPGEVAVLYVQRGPGERTFVPLKG